MRFDQANTQESGPSQVLPISPADFRNFFLPDFPPPEASTTLLCYTRTSTSVDEGDFIRSMTTLTTQIFTSPDLGNRGFTMTSFHLFCFVVELRRSLKARPTTISLKCFRWVCIHVARYFPRESRMLIKKDTVYRKRKISLHFTGALANDCRLPIDAWRPVS